MKVWEFVSLVNKQDPDMEIVLDDGHTEPRVEVKDVYTGPSRVDDVLAASDEEGKPIGPHWVKRVIILFGILILAGGCGESPTEPGRDSDSTPSVSTEASRCQQMIEQLESLPDGFWFGFDEEILETVKEECA